LNSDTSARANQGANVSFSVDVYWSFRSPYSYLATPRLVELQREYDVDVAVRPVYPIALRIPGFFKKVNPLWPPYLLRDCARIADMQGMPFAWPSPDPIVQDLATLEIAAEQPHIHRLTRMGVAAEQRGRGLAFIHEVGKLTFGGVKSWHEGDHLARATERAGLDYDDLTTAITSNAAELDAAIEQNEADQRTAGHWGVPLMVFRGEPFFGQDRIDVLLWRMKQAGLTRRG
jgi:2-hydroxychromene-2-carboxylate isomerase